MTHPTGTATAPASDEAFVARWRAFWAAPSPERVGALSHPDIAMRFPGAEGEARGVDVWRARVAGVLERFPDLVLEPTGFARAEGGYAFISWRATATVDGRPLQWEGIDRMAFTDGLVSESLVVFDRSLLPA
ncbi:hypothetical protein Afil01_55120 [Actinorhabdospora filicis]|uniref:SnoaL-like domain-containing protein n=1 Tax=Actinorhabdospora filicis TaxID=1785913 RepID=A0A9W6WDD2_9ACTN|nr:nuclear transport factor 2 family protein [Actinorhabdospora filicis]GLZ80705.1 hypothetical protein Afil01_55120 [Actinorhabdospora filicis]